MEFTYILFPMLCSHKTGPNDYSLRSDQTNSVSLASPYVQLPGGGGGGVLPYKGLTGTCGPTGYGFQDFCLERGIYFAPFCLKRGIFTWTNALNRISKYVYFIGT